MLHQQIDIERSVHAAAVDFLSGKATGLQDDSAAWLSKREEDARAKERELEVRMGCIVYTFTKSYLKDDTARQPCCHTMCLFISIDAPFGCKRSIAHARASPLHIIRHACSQAHSSVTRVWFLGLAVLLSIVWHTAGSNSM